MWLISYTPEYAHMLIVGPCSPFATPIGIMANLRIFYSIRFFGGFVITWGH